jgi:hypothetical protein
MAFNLLSMLGMLGGTQQAPGADNPLSQAPVNGPSAPSGNLEALGKARDFLLGQAMVGGRAAADPSVQGKAVQGLTGIEGLLQRAQAFRQQQAQREAMAKGVAGVQEKLRSGDVEGAADLVAELGATGMLSEKGAQSLQTIIDRARVRNETLAGQRAVVQATEAYKQGGPRAILENPELVKGLATYPGGIAKLLEQLQPKTEVKDGMRVTTPSVFQGGEPTVQGLPQAPKLDPDTAKILARDFHMDENDLKQGYLNNDPAVKAAFQVSLSRSRAETSFNRMGISRDVATVLGGMGKDPNKVASALEGGTPEQQQQASALIRQAEQVLQKRGIDQKVAEAQTKALMDRNLKANDPFKDAGHTYYDQQTGQPVHVTNAMAQNPGSFAANGGRLVRMTEKEEEQMNLMQSQMIPGIDAAETLAKRILAKANVANIPQGAKLSTAQWAGSADVKQFHEVVRQLALETSRIEGGSVRIPVTMLKNISETLPDNYSTIGQAIRVLETVRVAAENRRRSYLRRSDMLPIPTGPEPSQVGSRKAADFLKK